MKLLDVYDGRQDVEEFLYRLMAQRLEESGTNISHTSMPSMRDHQAFITRHAYRAWYVILTDNDEMAGATSLTDRNEVGVVVLPEFRNKGLAKAALRELMDRHPPLHAIASIRPGRFIANIRAGNLPSFALFKSLGATHIQSTYIL